MSDFQSTHEPEQVRPEISAVVKWFNSAKGFGFVQLSDGTPDAFLHASVVERSGHDNLPEGAALVCDIAQGPRDRRAHVAPGA